MYGVGMDRLSEWMDCRELGGLEEGALVTDSEESWIPIM